MTVRGASAPGKALLCGEYAVLHGAPALVTAVSRRAQARFGPEESSRLPPEAAAAFELAVKACGAPSRAPELEVSELRSGGTKLGLGSSAAAAVAVAGAVFAEHGWDLRSQEARDRLFDVALRGHEAVAPQGSGVDVAASTYGGYLRFERDESGIRCAATQCPADLHIRLVWTGQAARTSDLLAAVHSFAQSSPSEHRRCMDALDRGARAFSAAFAEGLAREVVEEAAAYAEAMRALGRGAGAPIVETRLERVASLAAEAGGAAKPCGAGGGDVAIAFFAEPEAVMRFDEQVRRSELLGVELSFGAEGVRPL